MHMFKCCSVLSTAAVIVGLSAGAALAESPFEGPYVGAFAGYGQTGGDVDASWATVSGLSGNGATGGVFAGVASRVGAAESLLLGMEADYGYADGSARLAAGAQAVEIDPGQTVGVSGVLGFTPADRLHVFGKLGYAHTRFGGIADEGRVGVDGFRYGGGGEYAINRSWALRGELARVEYDSIDAASARFDPAQTSVTAGLRRSF